MTPTEADEFIMRCRRVLPDWQREIDGARGDAKAEAQAAQASVLSTLMEIAEEFPVKRAKIDALARQYRYGVWAG